VDEYLCVESLTSGAFLSVLELPAVSVLAASGCSQQ
jgi:hypothetical protein